MFDLFRLLVPIALPALLAAICSTLLARRSVRRRPNRSYFRHWLTATVPLPALLLALTVALIIYSRFPHHGGDLEGLAAAVLIALALVATALALVGSAIAAAVALRYFARR